MAPSNFWVYLMDSFFGSIYQIWNLTLFDMNLTWPSPYNAKIASHWLVITVFQFYGQNWPLGRVAHDLYGTFKNPWLLWPSFYLKCANYRFDTSWYYTNNTILLLIILIIPSVPIHLREVWPELRRFWYVKQLPVIEREHSKMPDVDIFSFDLTCNVIGDIEVKKKKRCFARQICHCCPTPFAYWTSTQQLRK